jgi:ribonuclease E
MDSKHQEKVESAFRKAVYTDRARVQISNISRFGLLEVSRQRLRPSLNESYDIEHVLVRGPRSLGQSILRIIGEDSAKDNTAEIQVFVPSDVASYLLNEKRNDIMHIEKSNNIKVIIVADPYKSRPYYKVIRVKASDVKNIDSYKLVPNSPEPGTDWRDDKNINKSMKPLVSGIKPPKMPKKKKDGLVSWIKSIAGIDSEDKKTKKVVKKSNNRKPQQRRNANRKPKQSTNPKKPTQNKQNQQNKKPVNKKPNQQPKKSNDNQKNANKKTVEQKNSVQSKPKQKNQNNKNIKNDSVSKNVSSPKASEDVQNKDLNKKVKAENKPAQKKPAKDKIEAPKIKKPVIQEIKKEVKVKKEIPTRASNDPRDKT